MDVHHIAYGDHRIDWHADYMGDIIIRYKGEVAKVSPSYLIQSYHVDLKDLNDAIMVYVADRWGK